MKINDFKLECYFGRYEFTAPYLLTQSDCESMTTKELLSQWVLKEILSDEYYEQYLKELRIELKIRRDLMISALDRCFKELAIWEVPKGGFYIWLILKRDVPMEKLFQAALKQGILLNPGGIYEFKKNNALRLSYSYIDKKDIMVNIKKLSDVVRNFGC